MVRYDYFEFLLCKVLRRRQIEKIVRASDEVACSRNRPDPLHKLDKALSQLHFCFKS